MFKNAGLAALALLSFAPVVVAQSHSRQTSSLQSSSGQSNSAFRPPAVPLVVHDPYFSIWSAADQLNGKRTEHWTGKANRLSAYLRVDGKMWQVMGRDGDSRKPRFGLLQQTSVRVTPTRTLYQFEGAGVGLDLTFLTPALPEDLDVLSRPLTYLEWRVASRDGASHAVELLFDAAADTVVNSADEKVETSRYLMDGETVLRMGSQAQPVLTKAGDDLRIDWGYLYLMADQAEGTTAATLRHAAGLTAFGATGRLPAEDDFSEDDRGLAMALDFGQVNESKLRYLMIAYDDLYSIEYFQRKERPWWRRHGEDAAFLLRAGRRDHAVLQTRSAAFDERLTADMTKAGGAEYAQIGALAYRQTLGAYKLVADLNGNPLFFPKENFSNGCIATVDVIYPAAPFALLFNPVLLEAQLRPVLEYAQMARWRWPFAPHDLGTYPQANGQVYGGGERTEENQMPVEESGNMLILLAALAQVEGNAKFSEPYWPQLTKWAQYLKEKGLDPENQLSTDDFAGHLAHNANLSIKAILALSSYSRLAGDLGHSAEATEYAELARTFAKKWEALGAEGSHYRLAFDQPGSWSQKYNLVWDKLLNLGVFAPMIAEREMQFYLAHQNAYGLPLDSRKDYTKLDWIVWTATMAESKSQFETLLGPVYHFLHQSSSRVPMTDWYDTKTAKQESFQARSVVGGVFIKMLADPALWQRYAKAAQAGSAKTN